MTTEMEQAPIKVRVRRWRDVHSAWLVIEPGQLIVYRSKFIGGLQKVADFETSRLIGVERDESSNGTRLVFHSPQGQPVDEVFSFKGEKQAETANITLRELLKEAEERRKREEEEAGRLEKERQERLKQIREEFAHEVWETSEALWLIAKGNYSMVNAVITADWNEVRQHYSTIWQQTDRLKKTCQIELMTALKDIDEVVGSRNGEEVIKKASYFIKQLSEQVFQMERIWARWQDQKEMLTSVLPNCNHWSYFLLFSIGHFEALLSVNIEDWTGVNNVLPLLRASSTILHHCFDINLDGLIDAVYSAASERNTNWFIETAHRIESAVFSSFKAKPFKYQAPVQQLKE